MRTVCMAFFAVAVAFFGIGITGQQTFLWIGIALLVIFLIRSIRCQLAKQ
jgi:hypothetical protein